MSFNMPHGLPSRPSALSQAPPLSAGRGPPKLQATCHFWARGECKFSAQDCRCAATFFPLLPSLIVSRIQYQLLCLAGTTFYSLFNETDHRLRMNRLSLDSSEGLIHSVLEKRRKEMIIYLTILCSFLLAVYTTWKEDICRIVPRSADSRPPIKST